MYRPPVKDRLCRSCGIILSPSIEPTASCKAGRICKFCYRIEVNKKSMNYNRDKRDRVARCNEPEKKVCSECPNTFWTSRDFKKTCSPECGRVRKNRLDRELTKRLNEELLMQNTKDVSGRKSEINYIARNDLQVIVKSEYYITVTIGETSLRILDYTVEELTGYKVYKFYVPKHLTYRLEFYKVISWVEIKQKARKARK